MLGIQAVSWEWTKDEVRSCATEVSKNTPGDAKCAAEILGGGDKNKEVEGDKV